MGGTDSRDRPPIPPSPDLRPIAGAADYGAFERGEVIGRGGSATVYEATPVDDPGRVVALKEPHAAESLPAAVVDRFRREAETWAALDDHPHVVTVHAWGTDPRPWLALQHMDGGDLTRRVGECGVDEGLWTGACVASALAHAHAEGVAHLDLKPENVLLATTPDGDWPVPAVADWGMARALRSDTVDLEGLSPRYAAPEQFDPERFGSPGPATDVYQLAVVLYELLVGVAPFGGPPRALRDAVVGERPPAPSGRNPDLPAAVDDLLDRALAKAPGDRYGSMLAFQDALAGLLADRTGHDPSAEESLPPSAPDATTGTRPSQGSTPPEQAPRRSPPFDRALSLAAEGFVRLTDGYFARREPAPTLDAWRRGVTLADAHAGRAVERTVPAADGDERVSLTDRLLEGLADGRDHAVLGPPGSGKSTVCKQVACEWFDAGRGPVLYRESGRGSRFERPDALLARATATDGHALVVVEDAVRPEANAVFDLLDRVADVADVSVLVDARESEWRDADRGGDRFGTDVTAAGRAALDPVSVPRPDATELERFVRAVEEATDGPVDVDVAALRAEAERAAADATHAEGARPGELLYLLHRLTALAEDPLAAGATGSTLTDDVADVHGRLAELGDEALDVGVCANLLNAAGVGVWPALLHAVVPSDPVAVADAVDVLAGRVVFPRDAAGPDGTAAYPAVHEAWSTAFLDHLRSTAGARAARERFRRVVDRVLSLADDERRREQVAAAIPEEAPSLARIEREPGNWADEMVEALYTLGRERPKLAPLFGDGDDEPFPVPAACSARVADRCPVWLGWLFVAGGYYDRAQRAFDRVPETDELAVERLLGKARVAIEREAAADAASFARRCLSLVDGADRPVARARAELVLGRALDENEASRARYRAALDALSATDDRRWTARALDRLGRVARRDTAYDRAREHLQRSLDLARDLGDVRQVAASLTMLGEVAQEQAEHERARDRFERALAVCRQFGHRQGEAEVLDDLGSTALMQGEYDRAREYFERALAITRRLGSRRDEARRLNNLGVVAIVSGDHDRARDHLRRSLDLRRELGDRHGEVGVLANLGIVARRRGEYDRARERFETALETSRDIGYGRGEVHARSSLATVASRRGSFDRARDHLRRGLDVVEDIGHDLGEAYICRTLGAVALREGDCDRAAEHLERSLRAARAHDESGQVARTRRRLGSVALSRGDFDGAHDHLDAAADAARDDGDRFERTRVRLVRGRLALARGDLDPARARATRAREAFEEMDATHWVGRSRLLLGRVAAAAERPDDARDHWLAALSRFEAVGAPGDALATLRYLVTAGGECDRADVEGWCRRATDLLTDAPPHLADQHRGWVRDACDEFDRPGPAGDGDSSAGDGDAASPATDGE